MALSELGISFDPERTARKVHENVIGKHPSITPEDVHVVVRGLAEGARITQFIEALAHKQIADIAVGRTPRKAMLSPSK